jgi:hypothetical protein
MQRTTRTNIDTALPAGMPKRSTTVTLIICTTDICITCTRGTLTNTSSALPARIQRTVRVGTIVTDTIHPTATILPAGTSPCHTRVTSIFSCRATSIANTAITATTTAAFSQHSLSVGNARFL